MGLLAAARRKLRRRARPPHLPAPLVAMLLFGTPTRSPTLHHTQACMQLLHQPLRLCAAGLLQGVQPVPLPQLPKQAQVGPAGASRGGEKPLLGKCWP